MKITSKQILQTNSKQSEHCFNKLTFLINQIRLLFYKKHIIIFMKHFKGMTLRAHFCKYFDRVRKMLPLVLRSQPNKKHPP